MEDNQFHWFWQGLENYLSKNNLKQSKQRNDIIGVFLNLNQHINAEQLLNKAKEAGLKTSLATVYRTLNLLCEANLVIQHTFTNGQAVFEMLHPGDHHDHLICTDCGKIFEFENHDIELIQEKIAKEFGFQLTSHRLDMYGRCQKNNCPNLSK